MMFDGKINQAYIAVQMHLEEEYEQLSPIGWAVAVLIFHKFRDLFLHTACHQY